MKNVGKRYAVGKLMSQLSTSSFKTMLVFHILGSCLGYLASKGIVYPLFTITLLIDSITIISPLTQIEIVYKIYPFEVSVPNYQFWVHKTLSFSSCRVIFLVHHRLRNGF